MVLNLKTPVLSVLMVGIAIMLVAPVALADGDTGEQIPSIPWCSILGCRPENVVEGMDLLLDRKKRT